MVTSNYNGPKHVVEAFVDLNLDKDTRILDILAGSGLVAKLVRTNTPFIRLCFHWKLNKLNRSPNWYIWHSTHTLNS